MFNNETAERKAEYLNTNRLYNNKTSISKLEINTLDLKEQLILYKVQLIMYK